MLPDHIRLKNINHITYNVKNKDAALQEVDDIEAAHQYMLGKGVVPTAIQTRNDGQKAFYINDPDGNRIELCTKSGFGVLV